jgi:hypothetical protein
MTKIIVKTTGDFELSDIQAGQYVTNMRPHLVNASNFINQRIALGQLTVIGNSIDTNKSDADFEVALKDWDGDVELALANMLSEKEEKHRSKEERKAAKEAAKKAEEANKAQENK